MKSGHVKSSDGMRSIEIEQAAQTLRRRLAFATIKTNGCASLTVNALKGSCPAPALSSAFDSPFTTRTTPVEDGMVTDVGLGLGLDSSSNDDVKVIESDAEVHYSPPRLNDPGQPKVEDKTKEPSLYDAIFGPAYTRMTQQQQTVKQQGQPTTPPNLGQRSQSSAAVTRSPHVRRGSSAKLERVASSPRLSTSPRWGQMVSTQVNRDSNSFASPFASPSQRQRSHGGGSSQQHHAVASTTSTPSRNRMRSAGGSLLPNGHPASSLAQDLGIGSGSTPRSRNASANAHYLTNRQDYHNQSETDRLAGMLTSMTKAPTETPGRLSSTSNVAFADPNVMVTPRRRRRRSSGGEGNQVDGNEAAAHSLLDLAASPSPHHGHRQRDRFPGATPSLDGFFEARQRLVPAYKLLDSLEEDQSKAGREEEKEGSSSLSPHQNHSILQPAVSLEGAASRTPDSSFKLLASPPMTPPRSGRRPHNRSAFDADSDDSSPSTTTRRGQMRLVSEEPEKREARMALGQGEGEACKAADGASLMAETPRTPPTLSTPLTPKAPGSNFCYGEFLHVSPSPQPRMRLSSSNGTPRLTHAQDTPTRGTRSRARFISYGGLDMSEEEPLTTLEMSDVLTPGKHLLQASPRIESGKKTRMVQTD